MFDEKLKEILQTVYAGRVLVFSNYKIRETLFSKGISPAIFLHHFYERCGGDNRIEYTIKEKTVRELGDVIPMDSQEFQYFKEDRIKSLLRDRVSANYKIKPSREISREALMNKQLSENYLRSLHFSWFEQASKLFLYYMSLDDENHKQGFLEQPLGLTFLIEIDGSTNIKSEYEKIKKESDLRIKKMFSINPQRTKNIPTLVILAYNRQNKITYEDAQRHFESLRYDYKLDMDLTFVLEICNQDAKDATEWSNYSRPIFNIQYKLQPSDPIRLLGEKEENSLRAFVMNHRIKIRDHIQGRLKQLCRKYEQNNTAKNLFISFFKGSSSTQRGYSAGQAETREIADFLFMLGDHKRATEIYKSLADKFESNEKDQIIHYNICEMIQLSKCLGIFSPHFKQSRGKVYESIEKHAQKTMIKKAASISKFKLNRYLLYLLYFFHCFKIFNRDFIKNQFYYYVKKSVNEETVSNNYTNPLIIPALLHEQHANLNLMFPISEYRRYCYDLIRVAAKFSEYKLYYHNLRCFLIASKIYDGSFPLIERYINTSLCKAYLDLKKHRDTISCYQNTWNTLLKNYQDLGMKQYDVEFTKFENNYKKIVLEVEKANPAETDRDSQECIPVPKLQNLVIELVDEAISSSEDGESTWQKVGDVFLERPQLTSKGMNKQNMVKLLKMFDAVSSEERQLSFGVKNMQTVNGVSQAILKRNARVSFVGQPILLSFDMKNYLPNAIQFDSIQLYLKIDKPCSIRLKKQSNSFYLQAGHSENIVFQVIPKEVGLYQFSHVSWRFSKLKSLHKFKEPWESQSALKSVYCKINVLQQTGLMSVEVKNSSQYYEGQLSQIELVFSNLGTQEIEQIYIATDNQNIFSFRLKKLQFSISPGQKKSQSISIIIPLFDSNKNKTSFWKCVNKSIFLYKTKTSFRVLRNVTIFNIHKIAEINNVICERISRNLHFLSFSIKYGTNQLQQKRMLKSLVIDGNMDIKKTENNQFGLGVVQYFFFLRRNYQKKLEEFKFTLHGMNCADLISRNQIQSGQKQNRDDDSLNLYFVWSHQDNFGIVAPKPIAITATTNTDSQVKLPFSVKIMMQDQIQFDFDLNPLLQIEVEFRIKNIFERKEINLCVQLSEAGSNDIYWEGITQHFLHLKYNQESRFKVKILLFRSGIYNIAKNIKYINSINKAHSYTINHNQYQNLYLLVRNPKKIKEEQFDFFANFQPNTFKKVQKKEEISLI